MKKIVLLCAAGMSTSMLVKKMEKAAQDKGLEYSISAHSISRASQYVEGADLILLGPQIRYELEAVKKIASCPVQTIDMTAYGMMDGKKIIESAIEILEQKTL